MKIQINTDNHIEGREQLTNHYQDFLSNALGRFSEHMTRLEVHLSDENSHKQGGNDKRCLLEARVQGSKPVAVSFQASTLHEAVSGASGKLRNYLDTVLSKLHNH